MLEATELFKIRLQYNQEYGLSKGVSIRLKDAGHILGRGGNVIIPSIGEVIEL